MIGGDHTHRGRKLAHAAAEIGGVDPALAGYGAHRSNTNWGVFAREQQSII